MTSDVPQEKQASASPQFAEAFLQFGWVCEWDLSVFGESLAKVFKSL